MTRRLAKAINDNYDNTQLALTSRLAAANSSSDEIFFSGDLNKLVQLINAVIQLASPQQITNLYGGGVPTINTGAATTYTLTYPLALRSDFNPNAGIGLNASLPAYDSTQCELGQPCEFRNVGGANSALQIYDKDGNLIANTSIAPGAAVLGRLILKDGTTNTLTLDVIRNGTIASHDVSEFLSTGGGSMSGNLILNTDASQALQAVTYQQLNALIAGFKYKGDCTVATTAALTANYSPGTSGVGATLTNSGTQAALVIDGVTLSSATPDIVLVKNQAAPAQNGIYTVTNIGSGSTNWILTRATNYDTSAEISAGDYVNILNGTVNKQTLWQQTTTGTITVGTTAIAFQLLVIINVSTGLVLVAPNTIALADTAVTPGTYGSATKTTTFTVDQQGRLTAASQQDIAIPSSQITDKAAANGVASLDSGAHLPAAQFPALTGDITTAAGALASTLATVLGTPGSFGDASHVAALTVNAKGLVTAISSIAIAIASSALTDSTSAGRALLTAATVALQRTALGLGSAALLNTSDFLQTANNLSEISGASAASAARLNLGLGSIATEQAFDYLSKAANLAGLASASTARSNLGLGTIATQSATAASIAQKVITDATTARTLSPADVGGAINFTNTGTVTATIDSDANQAVPDGSIFILQNKGGAATLLQIAFSAAFVGAAGVSVNASSIIVGQNGYIVLQKIAANYWVVMDIYEEYNLSTTFTWGTFTTPSQPIRAVRIGRNIRIEYPPMGNFVNTQTNYLVSTSALPARFRPTGNTSGCGFVSLDNGTTQVSARFAIDNTGTLYITSATGGNFSATTQIKTEGYSLLFSN